MRSFEPVRVGVIGLGDISDVYLRMIARSPALSLAGVASARPDHSEAVAQRLGCMALTQETLLENDDVEVILDLTPTAAHDALNEAILRAGKHLYTEKPLALTKEQAGRLGALARDGGLKAASAPDTFFGASHQKARRLLDAGEIGAPVFGTAFMGNAGVENFHPNPEAFYRYGGSPPFDMGPYYVVQWVNLLGPVRRVAAGSAGTGAPRAIKTGPRSGQSFVVEVPTTYNCILDFDRASVALTLSLDVVAHGRRHMELYGETGLLGLSNPDFFGGEIIISRSHGEQVINVEDLPFGIPNRLTKSGRHVADYRGAGLVDLAIAVRTGVEPRASLDLAVHVVEVVEAMSQSAAMRQSIEIQSDCQRPIPIGARNGDELLLELAASPFDYEENDR